MRWDDFARVGAPDVQGPAGQGVSLGQDSFPLALVTALTRSGVHVDGASDLHDLEQMIGRRKPDFLIATAAALGPDPEMAVERLLGSKAASPAILVTSDRLAPESAIATTQFSELLGSGQDALGYFLMIRATLRRKRPHVMTEILEFGNLALDQEKFMLSLEGAQATLNKLQFCVLGAMLDAPRMVWNKVFLNRVVFGPVAWKPGRQFDTYMSLVRRSIRDKTGVDPIVAEHGMGYALSPAALGATGILGGGGEKP